MVDCNVSDYKESHMGGAPMVIYNRSDPELPMTVFSPLNKPMAHHMDSDQRFFGAGIKVHCREPLI